ncbi:MAG: 1,4-alpha-glucan branching enzyme [Fibrobacterota bacterium]
MTTTRKTYPLWTEFDLHLFHEGSHDRTWEHMGAHLAIHEGVEGVAFALWAPNASRIAVVGEFNGWNPDAHLMQRLNASGVWQCFVAGAQVGQSYKFHIVSQVDNYWVEKCDPYGSWMEVRPGTASRIADLAYDWNDQDWIESRTKRHALNAPISVYEMHLGSWRRDPSNPERYLTYREIARDLVEYIKRTGFTHVELMPVAEHPFDGSWGYQGIGYFAPTSRFGEPTDFKFFVDELHKAGIGILLDWVPAHFPKDFPGLAFFDGTHLYEHADPRQGEHKDWGTYIFNFGRNEVKNFLISNALFWLSEYHIDGLRVDAVASMLYLDYSREADEWVPNQYGGRENIEAINFLRTLNEKVHAQFPGTFTVAEESTAWPGVSRPTYVGGLGFTYKWDMGWMHDTLAYAERDPIHRKWHHDHLTFRMLYSNSENFTLPLSHDEVVHLKGSLLTKMPGDWWQKFANLRLLYANQWGNQGKKLLFMGGEFGQWTEWNECRSLDWHLEDFPTHRGVQNWVGDLNRLYVSEPAMHQLDCAPEGFAWVDCTDTEQSVVSFLRRGKNPEDTLLWVFNYTPSPRMGYRVGVPFGGFWQERLNSDASVYGGSGMGNCGGVQASDTWWQGLPHSLELTLPPLSAVVFKPIFPDRKEPGA